MKIHMLCMKKKIFKQRIQILPNLQGIDDIKNKEANHL